jgi:hypothetical protein
MGTKCITLSTGTPKRAMLPSNAAASTCNVSIRGGQPSDRKSASRRAARWQRQCVRFAPNSEAAGFIRSYNQQRYARPSALVGCWTGKIRRFGFLENFVHICRLLPGEIARFAPYDTSPRTSTPSFAAHIVGNRMRCLRCGNT